VALAVLTAACGGASAAPSPARSAAATAATAVTAGHCPASVDFGGSVDDHGAAAASGGASVTVEAADSFFSPTCMTAVRAGTIQLTVRNTGKALHNVSVPAQSVDRDLAPGETVTVKLTMGPGDLIYFCKYHRAAGMLGALAGGPP
jgi:plastocyanin